MKKTRFALFQSVICLMLCFSMLVGTTFAWFTDTVTSNQNVIAAGTLDVELEYWTGSAWAPVTEATNVFEQNTLWEPGHTEVVYLRLSNAGSLALNYRFGINIVSEQGSVNQAGEAFKLSQFLRFGTVESSTQALYATREQAKSALTENFPLTDAYTDEDPLYPVGNAAGLPTEKFVTLVVYMPEEVGNAANYATGAAVPKINLGLQLVATQQPYEQDSFNGNYDTESEMPAFPFPMGGIADSATGSVNADGEGKVSETVQLQGSQSSAIIPEGVQLENGTQEVTLTVNSMSQTGSNLQLEENQEMTSLNVHVSGVATNNTVPMVIQLVGVLPVGLNIGNYSLYHVENGVTNEMTAVATAADVVDHNDFYYDPATGNVTVAMKSFSEIAAVSNQDNTWKGNFDYSWYDASKTELTIANADQLAAFGAIVGGMKKVTDRVDNKYTYSDEVIQDSFADKTIKLIADINLGDSEKENNPNLIFYPIGYWNNEGTYERLPADQRVNAVSSGFYTFNGTFDGNGHTISNFYQNTWEMKGDHDWYDTVKEQYYRDGMGLFGRIYGGTVKNLTVRNFKSDGEIATTGVIAAYADFGATFENIAIFDCNPRVYNIGNGGIVGCVGWYTKGETDKKVTFKNITVDNSNKISALWGSYDVACGGIVGQYYPTSGQTSAGTPKNAGIHFENCHISAVMDVYNDVCANYQYYAYRYTGMLIGSVRENETIDGKSYPKMDGISAKDCTVHFGDWNDYYYCEIIDNTTASYTHDYQMSRLTEIKAINGTTITYLDGTTGTVPASGRANYVIVDYTKGHGTENATCYHFKDGAVWTHDMGGIQTGIDENKDGQDDLKEDKQHIYLEFNNLVTGYGWGVTSKGVDDLDGVDILDKKLDGSSVEKFEGKVTELSNNKEYKLGDIFNFVDKGVELIPGALTVTVTNLDDNNPVSATVVYDRENWENGTLTLTGTGKVQITIQDYYFCTPTTIEVTIGDRQAEEKFDIVMNNGDFLHRVGNVGAVALDKLFKAKDGVTVGTVSVTVEAVDGTGASGTYSNNAIQFNGTGVVKVTITDNDYCEPTELILEVVDATNVTSLSGTLSGNVVLLNDCGLSSLTVSGRNTVYGNGFTATYSGNGQHLNNGTKAGVITVSENGMLDNLRVKATIYPVAYLFYSEAQKGPSDGNNRYFYQLSAVAATGNATISNCYIYGGRNNLFIGGGNVTVRDTVLECGTLSNVQIISSEEYTVTFDNVTTIQHQVNATYGDTGKVMFGAGILVGDGDKDDTTATAPNIVLNGSFKQYNWVTLDDKNAVSDSNAKMIIDTALNATAYNHAINGKTASNLGIIFLNVFKNEISIVNNTSLPYVKGSASMTLAGASVSRTIYSVKGAGNTEIYSDHVNANRNTVNGLYQPQFKYSTNLGGQYIEKTDDGDEYVYREGDTIKVMFPAGDTKELNLASLVDITKYSGQDLNLVVSCKGAEVKNGKITISAAGEYTVTYTVTDTLFYDKDGNEVVGSKTYSWDVVVSVSLKEKKIQNARFEYDTDEQKYYLSSTSGSSIVQFIPFLSGLKIYDYDANGKEYLRFDGGNTSKTTDYDKIVSATIDNKKESEAQGNHIVTIEFEDGGKLVIDMDVRANSGSSKHTGSIKVRNSVIYVVNNGTTSGTGTAWTIYSYKFVGNNGVEINSGVKEFKNGGKATKPTENFGGGDSGDNGECIIEGTLITMADGTQKPVEDLVVGDMIMVFNHVTGQYEAAPLIFNTHADEVEADNYDVLYLQFSDGKELKIVQSHGLFDMTLMQYVYVDYDNYQEFIGHEFYAMNSDGTAGEKVTLTNAFIKNEYVRIFCPVTYFHMNSFANGLLNTPNIPGGITGLVNYFEYDPDLKYNEEAMQRDIEKYGLYSYEDFSDYISEAAYHSSPAVHLKVAVGKGMITFEEILAVIEYLLAGSLIS